ncbi:MAG TPA: hypothetical protein PKC67_15655 [Kiritimatiellia bacterium]|nr:hypothetical protein [Kiritimatiellia bacterium]
MKKITALLLGSLIASSAAFAQTNAVLSRNAVGYIKIPLESNKLYLVSNPFVNLSAGPQLVSNVFASVPGGTTISVWNEANQTYDNYLRNSRGVWSGAATTAQLSRADGIFIRMPATNAPVDLFFMGEVPDRFTAPSNLLQRVPGIAMVGYPYPVTMRLTNTVMAQSLPNGSTVSIWVPGANTYTNYLKNLRGAWVGDALTADLTPGQGLVIRATNAANSWFETKPYTWP